MAYTAEAYAGPNGPVGPALPHSSSIPSNMESPQSDWSLQLSQLLNALGENQYNWALQQYGRGQQITDQSIDQFRRIAGQGEGLANQLQQQYSNVFQPMMDKYAEMAASYNSEARQRFEMGRAESTASQAGQRAISEAERRLEGFGVNTGSGRSQQLEMSSRLARAAMTAGAGTEASRATAETGRGMIRDVAAMGQNVPAQVVNAGGLANAATTGAQSANLGMLNTGAALTGSAAPFLSAAAGANKLPPVGNTSQTLGSGVQMPASGGGSSGGSSGSGGRGPGAGGAGAGGPGSGLGGGPSSSRQQPEDRPDPNRGQALRGNPPLGQPGQNRGIISGLDKGQYGEQEQFGPNNEFGPWQPEDPAAETQYGPFEDPASEQYGPFEDPASQQYGPFEDPAGDQTNTYGGSAGNYGDYGGGDYYGGSGGGSEYQAPEDPSYTEDYAQGGVIPDRPRGGGFVPPSMSPSRGRQTDDVAAMIPQTGQGARINVGEFVIPQDVVQDLGQSHFRKLIKKSRELRTGRGGPPARPTMKPGLRMRPDFARV